LPPLFAIGVNKRDIDPINVENLHVGSARRLGIKLGIANRERGNRAA